MNMRLIHRNIRSMWKEKTLWAIFLVPFLISVVAWMAFENSQRYTSINSIYGLTVQLSLILIVPLGVFLAHWDQKKAAYEAQMVLTKPITRMEFFISEYVASTAIIYLFLLLNSLLVSGISYVYGHFSWKILLAFSATIPTVLLLEGTLALVSLVFPRSHAIGVGMILCCGGLFRSTMEGIGNEVVDVSGIGWIFPNLEFGIVSSLKCMYPEVSSSFVHSFFIWIIELFITISLAYVIFSRRDY
ncbi:MAG: hypothetical protein U9N35_08555 [Euryarchaeota archaeon]|nr:hypothetical protein [Euryarchaeota archaeon]